MFSATAVGSRCPCGCGRGLGRGVTIYRYGIMAQTLTRPAGPNGAVCVRCSGAEEMRGRVFGGEGKEAEVDGGYFGGYVKPANQKNIAVTAAWHGTKMASARLLS